MEVLNTDVELLKAHVEYTDGTCWYIIRSTTFLDLPQHRKNGSLTPRPGGLSTSASFNLLPLDLIIPHYVNSCNNLEL